MREVPTCSSVSTVEVGECSEALVVVVSTEWLRESKEPSECADTTEVSSTDGAVIGMRSPKRGAKPFDFRQPKTLERNQLKALQMIFEGFARPASSILGANLRVSSRIEIIDVQQRTWEELLGEDAEPAAVSVFNLAPLPPRAVLIVPAELALRMVDLRLGGGGGEVETVRGPTDIEQVIISTVIGEVIAQVPIAFSSLVELRVDRLHQEVALQFVQGIPLNEMCVTVQMSMTIAERDPAEVTLVLPFAMLRPILDQLGNRPTSVVERQSESFTKALSERLLDTVVETKVVFRPTHLTSGEILDLEPGDVIRLGHRQGTALDVMVDDVKLYRAQPTQVGARIAILLVEES
jgi:flagellar motor switch protein FliM